MSVISTLAATPSRAEIVYRFLRHSGGTGVAPDVLLKTLSSPGLTDGGGRSGIAADVVRECKRLGIITVEADGCYRLCPALCHANDTGFLLWLEAILLDPTKAEAADQASFPYALAWLLEQDPAEPFEFGDNISDLITSQCGSEVDAFGLTNRARSQNFVYWAQYLGYAWRLGVENFEAVMPDPTRAIERHLPQLLGGSKELLISELLHAWGTRSPVLDGGTARKEIVEMCQGTAHRDSMLLSRSSSIALLRLEERGVIKLERRADALTHTLNTKPNLRPISHLVWQEGR